MFENWKQSGASIIGGILTLFSGVPIAEVIGVLSIVAGVGLTAANIRLKIIEGNNAQLQGKKLEHELEHADDHNK